MVGWSPKKTKKESGRRARIPYGGGRVGEYPLSMASKISSAATVSIYPGVEPDYLMVVWRGANEHGSMLYLERNEGIDFSTPQTTLPVSIRGGCFFVLSMTVFTSVTGGGSRVCTR